MKITVEFELEALTQSAEETDELMEELEVYLQECNYPEMCQEPEVAGYDFFKHFFWDNNTAVTKTPVLKCWPDPVPLPYSNPSFFVKSLKFKV